MEITEVKVFPVRDKKLRAFVSIVFDGSFMVNDIKVIQGKDGFFISMPSRRKKNGRFKDIAHPLNQETRQAIEDRIVAEYRRVVESGESAPAKAAVEPSTRTAAGQASEARPDAGTTVEREKSAELTAGPAEEFKGPGGERPRETREADDKSLEEVAEDHLSDSYWTT